MRTSVRNAGLGLLAAVPLAGLLLAAAPARAVGSTPVLPCPPSPGRTFCVTRTTPVYASLPPGAQVGQLLPGRAYFAVCQVAAGRVTRGEYHSRWWVRTDSGWASEIDIAGLADDRPIPGLASC
ncbi:hypothetical protein [Streptomyces sediminimaris]|uniref:hypothetical protein n=1 Tax=Streptomyces sediminimaris TaxID=3383721 RepID=UPI00399C31A2